MLSEGSKLQYASCFQLKTSFLPCAVLQLTRYDLDAIEEQLKASIQRAPHFFQNSPVILDLEAIKTLGMLDFPRLKDMFIAQGLVPIGVRGGSEEQIIAAKAVGLPFLTISKTSSAETANKKSTENPSPTTKLVSTPVRAGMQVYARASDLIMIGKVSPGAELLSDGHIHVYGTLRGRAMAGVQGNKNARIFCQKLEAELVSIAGFYLTKEDMQSLPTQEGMIQIYLDNDEVKISGI
jgi:septum site-determining protein MinC